MLFYLFYWTLFFVLFQVLRARNTVLENVDQLLVHFVLIIFAQLKEAQAKQGLDLMNGLKALLVRRLLNRYSNVAHVHAIMLEDFFVY